LAATLLEKPVPPNLDRQFNEHGVRCQRLGIGSVIGKPGRVKGNGGQGSLHSCILFGLT
jgi:hypothetical protein